MISKEKILGTDYFKTLEPVKKLLITNKSNVVQIELGINMSKLKGFAFWVKTANPREMIKGIVKELIQK